MVSITVRLSDDELKSIGKVAVEFAMLDKVTLLAISRLAGVEDNLGHALMSELSSRQLRFVLSSMGKELLTDPKKHGELDVILGRSEEAEKRRNQLLHSVWSRDSGNNLVRLKYTAKQGKGVRTQAEPMSAADIWQIAMDIDRVAAELGQFMSAIGKSELR